MAECLQKLVWRINLLMHTVDVLCYSWLACRMMSVSLLQSFSLLNRSFNNRFALLLLSFFTIAQYAEGYPAYFLNASRIVIPEGQKCIAHPTDQIKTWRHNGTIEDSNITFEISYGADNRLADILCPGGEHLLKISFGAVRRALLNSNPPIVNFTLPAPEPAECPNQVILGPLPFTAAADYTTRFTVPCSVAGRSVVFKVTAAGSVGSPAFIWRQASRTVSVASAASSGGGGLCGEAITACALGTPASPVDPAALTSPSPSPTAAGAGGDSGSFAVRNCTPSTMGYDCMATWRNVTVHWTLNATAAPNNPCTPAAKTRLKATELGSYGSLHMAVQSSAQGYVALGFAQTAGGMIPSDIILGWVGSDSLVPVVGTFDASKSGDLPAHNTTADSWAYDTGAILNSTSGVTTICFSRRLADSRAKAVPSLLESGGTILSLNWAVSDQDAVVVHRFGSVGGFRLDMFGGLVEQEGEEEDEEGEVEGEEKASAPTAGDDGASGGAGVGGSKRCTPSPLGYECMAQQGKVTVHWTVNAASAPANPCTPSRRTALSGEELSQNGAIHMAVQSASTGYVGLGFNANPTGMYYSDIFMGWVEADGRTWKNTFYASRDSIGTRDVVNPSWAYDTGVARDGVSGIITVCFSRRLMDSRAVAVPDLRSAVGVATTTTIASSSGDGGGASGVGGRRSLASEASGSSITASLGFIWAVSTDAALVAHRYDDAGGFYLNLASGSVMDAEAGVGRRYWINVHGALMAVAWGLLLPLGTLLPAHRWLLGDLKLGGKHVWFLVHLACQWSGMALFIAGFVVAFTKLDGASGELLEAHENIGIAVMAAAGAQVVFAYLRPDPSHPRRGLWNLLHHNLGRATVLLAWANVYIGIVVYHTNFGASYTPWITPIAVVMGLLVLADIALRFAGIGRKDPTASARGDTYRQEQEEGGSVKAVIGDGLNGAGTENISKGSYH